MKEDGKEEKKNQNDQHNLSIGITPFFIIADGIHLSIPILSASPSFFFIYLFLHLIHVLVYRPGDGVLELLEGEFVRAPDLTIEVS